MTEHPAVDVTSPIPDFFRRRGSSSVVGHRVLTVPRTMVQRIRIVAQARFHQCWFPQTDSDEDVEPRAVPIHEQPGDVRRVVNKILGRRRFVVDVARVDVGAVANEVLCDFDRARAV